MNDARWLSEHEQGVWRRFLAATGRVNDELERQLQRDSGLPHAYYEVLVSLSEAPDRTLRMSELAERSRSSRSRMSHAVARLEQAGLIERKGCPSDKRGAFAVLTEKGYSALADAAPGHVNAVREVLFDTLTPNQVRQLGEICSAIIDGRPADAE
ncbi:MAG TPA: MarR family transcriptional regulator [Pseudonocardiaceae bacterium]|jgi:DNA-binding MarR family transcriptional regulator|nr:MarR family transcriptional regulator [Pseudonocardiaceae bacterium]